MKKNNPEHKGLRYNTGKLRYDLVPAFAQQEYVKVLTKGAEKYFDRNWEIGLSWTSVLASLKRHIVAFEQCEDFDPETGLLHMAHVMCNAAFLTEFYKTYPEGDDRPHSYLRDKRIGLDVDEVIADWVGHWTKYHGQVTPEFWNFDKDIGEKFAEMKDNKDFWMSIPPKINPRSIPFEPCCYVTSRVIPTEWTEEWIQNNGFPTVPVYTVGHNESKVDVIKKAGCDWFVDDRYENFVELNRAGICCFLMDAPHNRRYNVGYKRIYCLDQLLTFFGSNSS